MRRLPDVNAWVALLDEGRFALAVAHKGCLATLDHRVALSAVLGAAAMNLLLL